MKTQKKIIILFIFLCLLFVSCQKARIISETKTDEQKQLVQIVEDEIAEANNLEKVVTQTNDELRPMISIKERIAIPFIEAVRSHDKNEILKFLRYPIRRPFPLPHIINDLEMLKKFDLIFTDEVLNDIIYSSDSDWNSHAWRGVTFYNGRTHLWMDYDGTVLDIPVSSQEEELVREFWEKDRERLMPEFSQFGECEGLFASATYKLRVDSFIIGSEWYDRSYRVLLWERNSSKTMSDMPDLILTDMKIARSRGNMTGQLLYFIEKDKVYVIEMPSFYIDKGELFIGEYTESFNPVLFDEYKPILAEEFVWSE
jgi:hypothetical protein